MLSPRLNDCPECADIPSLLKKIDCKLAELGNNLYNNISYMLNKPIPAGDILQLIGYRRILTYKYCNPNYVHKYSVKMIASRVIRLTLGCVSRCNEPERCLEEPCDIIIVPNPVRTTTTTTTLPITTTTTTSSTSSTSSTTTSTTTICQDCIQHDVIIGTQTWAGCNLDVTTYRNGDPIPEVTNQAAWESLTTGAWCYYNNDPLNGATYGKIYNWYAVNDPRGLAPTGYDVPTDDEWTTLVNYLGGDTVAGGHLKEQGFCHWASPNTGADNSSGFTALPSGRRRILTLPEFELITYVTSFWTSTPNFGGADGYAYQLGFSDTLAIRGFYSSENGFVVRCIKNTRSTTTTTTSSSTSTTTTTSSSSSTTTTTSSTSSSTTTSTTTVPPTSTTTSTSSSTSTTTTTSGVCPNCINHDVTIGTQIWTGCNLDITTYRNGDTIPQVTDPTAWLGLTTGAWCYYNNDPANGTVYGKLYNWYAVTDPRGLAPVGYHIPSVSEMNILGGYLGGNSVASNALKETGLCHWVVTSIDVTNISGFTAFPGGGRDGLGATTDLGIIGRFWTTTPFDPIAGGAYSYNVYTANSTLGFGNYQLTNGYSIRLIKD